MREGRTRGVCQGLVRDAQAGDIAREVVEECGVVEVDLVNGEKTAGSTCIQLQLVEHERDHLVPASEVEVVSKSSQIVEEVPPRAPGVPDGLNHRARLMQGGVEEKGQE